MNISTLNQTTVINIATGTFRKMATRAAITLAITAALIGCTSESDSDLVINSDTTTGAQTLTTDTDQIVRNAAANIAGPMQANYSGITDMASTVASTPAVNQMLKSVSNEKSPTDNDRTVTANTNTGDQNNEETTEDDIEQLLMMFIAPSTGATTIRNGNTITIDPDDNNVCQEILPDSADSNEMSACTQFITGFAIEIVADSDDAGVATLQYDQQAIITFDYAPDSSSMEFRLQGIHTVMQQLVLLENDGGTVPEVMQGAFTVSASVTKDSSGTEQVLGSMSVTEAINIVDSTENITLSLKPSTLVAMQATGSTETIKINIEDLKFSEQLDDEEGTGTAVAAILVPGFTANIEVHDNDSVKVTQLGFGKGPFRATIDDADMIKLTLAQFGFQIDGDEGLLTLTDALNFDLMVDNVGGYLDDELPASFNAQLSANAAANTTLLEQDNESLKVTGGGPVNFAYQINDGTDNPTGSFSANAGDCFDLADDLEETTDQFLAIVPCE